MGTWVTNSRKRLVCSTLTPLLSVFGRLKWEDPDFKNSLGYTARPWHKENKKMRDTV